MIKSRRERTDLHKGKAGNIKITHHALVELKGPEVTLANSCAQFTETKLSRSKITGGA